MNKSLNVFLSVLLCVVLCVGVLTSLYTTDESNTWQSDQVHTSSASAGAPSVSFGVGANGDVLAVPMSFRRSSREQYLQPSRRSTGVADLQGLARSAKSTGMLSLPSLQGGDGGRLFTHMSSSQTMKSFGGGSNTGGVSMSGGVVSTNNLTTSSSNNLLALSPHNLITSSPTSLLAFSPNNLLASSPNGLIASSTGARGIGGRHNAPGTLGGEDNNYINWLESEGWIYGEGCSTLTEQEVRDLYAALTGDTSFQNIDQWNAFWEWFMGKQSDSEFKWKLPLSDAIPFVLLLALAYALYIFVNRKQIQTK